MSRKQAICYLIVALLAIAVGLFFLALLVSVWVMLLVVLLLVLVVGLLLRWKPTLFQVFRKQSSGAYPPIPQGGGSRQAERQPIPGLILIGLNTPDRMQIVIDKAKFSLGRDPKCDYALTSCADISRVHAVIQYDQKRQVMLVTDKNSHNGTFLNNVRLEPGQPKKISDGDLLQLGTLRFSVQSARY